MAKFDAKTLVTFGAIGAGLYLVWKALSGVTAGAKAIGTALTSTGEAIGSGLYDYFNPDAAGESTYYIVTFSNGAKHAIAASDVDSGGLFTFNAVTYRLLIGKDGSKVAVTP